MAHVAMRQVIADASKNRKVVIRNDDVSAACRSDGGVGRAPFAPKPGRFSTRARAAPLWITAAFFVTTWTSQAQAFSSDARRARAEALAGTEYAIAARRADFDVLAGVPEFETVQAGRFGHKSMRLAQAATGDTDELQKALEQEHRRAELLARELTITRHLEMLLSFALAETYDPLILRKWGAYGTRSDAAKARSLYAKAQAGEVKEAKERLDALRR